MISSAHRFARRDARFARCSGIPESRRRNLWNGAKRYFVWYLFCSFFELARFAQTKMTFLVIFFSQRLSLANSKSGAFYALKNDVLCCCLLFVKGRFSTVESCLVLRLPSQPWLIFICPRIVDKLASRTGCLSGRYLGAQERTFWDSKKGRLETLPLKKEPVIHQNSSILRWSQSRTQISSPKRGQLELDPGNSWKCWTTVVWLFFNFGGLISVLRCYHHSPSDFHILAKFSCRPRFRNLKRRLTYQEFSCYPFTKRWHSVITRSLLRYGFSRETFRCKRKYGA